MHDDKEIAVQISTPQNSLEVFRPESYLVMVKKFDAQTWEMEEPRELWIPKKGTL